MHGTDPDRAKVESQLCHVAHAIIAYEAITGRYPPTDPIALASSLRSFTNTIDGERRQISLVNPNTMGPKGPLLDVWGCHIEVRIVPEMGIITARSPGRNHEWDGGTNDDIVVTITKDGEGRRPTTSIP